MRSANRVAEDSAARPLRENAGAAGVVEVNVSRKHCPEVFQTKARIVDPTLDGIDSARGAGVEKHKAAVRRHQERCYELGGTKELQVQRLNFLHSSLRRPSLTRKSHRISLRALNLLPEEQTAISMVERLRN
jgi:hypothetical protein